MGVSEILRKVPSAFAACRSTVWFTVAAMLIAVPTAHSQQPSPRQAEKTDKTAQAQEELVKKPDPPHLPDLVSDNLDHVSATADQILQIVDRDPGMMVELKQRFAEDAGRSGQILEETDLTDAAISDRLRQDLHTRVMATRLLQRYGYLLPKVNPDSDVAAEHNLEMRARVQELERAAEPHEASQPAPQTVIPVGSAPPSQPLQDCGRTIRQPFIEESGVVNAISPETLPATPEGHLSLVKVGGRESASSALSDRANPTLPLKLLLWVPVRCHRPRRGGPGEPSLRGSQKWNQSGWSGGQTLTRTCHRSTIFMSKPFHLPRHFPPSIVTLSPIVAPFSPFIVFMHLRTCPICNSFVLRTIQQWGGVVPRGTPLHCRSPLLLP